MHQPWAWQASTTAGLRTWIGLCLGALLTAVGVMGASPAHAHTSLVGSFPADQATLDREPSQVSLTFDEPIGQPAFVVVTAPDGSSVNRGEVVVADNRVSAVIEATGMAGRYTVAFRVTSSDGHTLSDELSYTVSTGRSVPAGAVTDSAGSSGSLFHDTHIVHFALAGAGVLGALFVLYGPRRRRRG